MKRVGNTLYLQVELCLAQIENSCFIPQFEAIYLQLKDNMNILMEQIASRQKVHRRHLTVYIKNKCRIWLVKYH